MTLNVLQWYSEHTEYSVVFIVLFCVYLKWANPVALHSYVYNHIRRTPLKISVVYKLNKCNYNIAKHIIVLKSIYDNPLLPPDLDYLYVMFNRVVLH